MDPKVTLEIIKTGDELRKKFQSLKRGIKERQDESVRFFEPVLQPLEDIRQEIRKKKGSKPIPKTDEILSTKGMKTPGGETMWWEDEDFGTPEQVSMTDMYTQTPPSVDIQTPSIYRRSPLIPEEKPVSTPGPSSRIKEEEVFESEAPLVEQVREYVKTPKGEDELAEHLRTAGELQREYLEKLFKGRQALDFRYGIRVMPDGNLAIGDSTDIQLFVNSNDISINGNVYEGTPGLLQLLYLKSPQDYTESDLKNYKNILVSTNAHKKGYSEERGLSGNRSEKYLKIISKLFRPQYLSSVTKSSSPVLRKTTLRSFKRGTGLMEEGAPVYEYWNNANELVDRLRKLLSSSYAGHEGHRNEIESIIEELREENIIC